MQTALRRRPPLRSTPMGRATASYEEESERKVLVASRASVRGANIYRGTTPPLLMGGHRDEVESWFRIHSPAKGVDALTDARRAIDEFRDWKAQYAPVRRPSPQEKEEQRRLLLEAKIVEEATKEGKKPTEGEATVAAGDSDESKEEKVHKVRVSQFAELHLLDFFFLGL